MQKNLTEHKPYLDGWRGLAILLVLIGHFLPNNYLNFGRLGVDLFFVLSGHLMAQLLFVKQVELKTFYKRRISRIFPAMIAFLLGSLLLAPLLGLKVESLPLLMASTFTINYVHALGLQSSHIYEHFWSLSVEEHSYLLLGLVAYIVRRHAIEGRHPVPINSNEWQSHAPVNTGYRVKHGMTLTIIGTLAFLAILNGFVSTLYFKQSFYESYWRSDVACGAILISAFITVSAFKINRVSWLILFVLGAIVLYLSLNRFPTYAVKYSLGTACLAFIVVHLNKAPEFLRQALSIKPLTFLGTISYSLYLWQQIFYVALPTHGLALMLTCTFIAAIFSYYLIEQPARKFLNARW